MQLIASLTLIKFEEVSSYDKLIIHYHHLGILSCHFSDKNSDANNLFPIDLESVCVYRSFHFDI